MFLFLLYMLAFVCYQTENESEARKRMTKEKYGEENRCCKEKKARRGKVGWTAEGKEGKSKAG